MKEDVVHELANSALPIANDDDAADEETVAAAEDVATGGDIFSILFFSLCLFCFLLFVY